METKVVSTRRGFIWKAGAALSAPLAATTAAASALSGDETASLQVRIAVLEDMNAIRELQQGFARHLNSGAREEMLKLFSDPARAEIDESVRGLSSDGFGEQDLIELAADRRSATARIRCTVQTETPIAPDCTLAEMALLQGDGLLRQSAKRVLESACVKRNGVWKLRDVTFRPA